MLKAIFDRLKKRTSSSGPKLPAKTAIARWAIFQYCKCPHCDHEFDVIQANLKSKANQGTIKVSQKVVNRYDKDKFDYEEINVEIPTPPYFGAFCEDTENLNESIDCVKCANPITIEQVRWGYGN